MPGPAANEVRKKVCEGNAAANDTKRQRRSSGGGGAALESKAADDVADASYEEVLSILFEGTDKQHADRSKVVLKSAVDIVHEALRSSPGNSRTSKLQQIKSSLTALKTASAAMQKVPDSKSIVF